jgi:ABC-2 type transport system permease protein
MKGLRPVWVIAKKDIRIYYLKAPVLIFGVLFPVCLFLAFAIGRSVPLAGLVPGLVAITLFFTTSSVSPAIAPWETQARTLERLLCAPLTIPAILAGDVLASYLFGGILSLVPVGLGFLLFGASVAHPVVLAAGFLLSGACFAILGVLLSSPPTDKPSEIMMLSNLVRLPLIFFSGVFLPLEQMPAWGQWVASISPLTYCTELLRYGFGGATRYGPEVSLPALLGFALLFWVMSVRLHRRSMSRRIWA